MVYEDYSKESAAFAHAILSVLEDGDADGMPFAFPKVELHINQDSLEDEEGKKVIMHAC